MANCSYSFRDLFEAAFHRAPERAELENLYALPRADINRTVLEWARLAGWETRSVRGAGGEEFVSFWKPEQ